MVTNFEPQVLSDLPIPPGELLEEEIAVIGMTQQQLAIRTGRPPQVINEIIRGKKAITHETAIGLEKVLGIPAHVWVNLEATYNLTQARLKEREELLRQEGWLKEFPVRELEKRGWIQANKDKADKIRALLEFLGVASFQAWHQTHLTWRQTVLGFRISENSKVSLGALAAWMRKGEREGQDTEMSEYDEKRFRDAVQQIRTMTSEEPRKFVPKMKTLCANAGVAVVFTQELPKSGANGVSRWLTPTKGLIQMSLRWKWHDIFWFSFFHECCHVLHHQVREVYIDGLDGDPDVETVANVFAGDLLIPPDAWKSFVSKQKFTEVAVRQFASEIEIHPGIIVGRMQHEGIIPYSSRLTCLKERLQWVTE